MSGGRYRPRHGQDQRTRHREADIESHRLEQFALQTFEAEQRQEHDDDDQDRKRHRVRNFARSRQYGIRAVNRLPRGTALGHDAK